MNFTEEQELHGDWLRDQMQDRRLEQEQEEVRTHHCFGDGSGLHPDGCRASIDIRVPAGLDSDDRDAHLLEIAEAVHGWQFGRYCPECTERAQAERKADDL